RHQSLEPRYDLPGVVRGAGLHPLPTPSLSKIFSLFLGFAALHRSWGERDFTLLHRDAEGDLGGSFLLECADLRPDQIREFVERDRLFADLATRLGEALV